MSEDELEDYEHLPIVVFAAFSIEAYVNSIGSRKIVFWDQIERLPWKSKIEILHQHVGVTANWGSDPLQLATQLFTIRDRLAHGKEERVSGPVCDEYMEAKSILMVEYLKPQWFRDANKDWLMGTEKRLLSLLRYLGALYKLPSDDHTNHSHGSITEQN